MVLHGKRFLKKTAMNGVKSSDAFDFLIVLLQDFFGLRSRWLPEKYHSERKRHFVSASVGGRIAFSLGLLPTRYVCVCVCVCVCV